MWSWFSSKKADGIPQPHGVLFNPFLTIAEKCVSTLIMHLMSFDALSQTEVGSKQSEEDLSKLRNAIHDAEYGKDTQSFIAEWSKATSPPESPDLCVVAESSGSIPFQKDILQEWNIVDKHAVLSDAIVAAANNREGVKVIVRFPSSLLPAELQEKGTVLDYSGCLEVDFDKVDWRSFAPGVPILVHFHGGGMIAGVAHTGVLYKEAVKLTQNAPTSSPPNLITISVDYGLAPEDPFPLGVMDALSVVDYLLKDNDSRKTIHVTGTSAGANLSLVTGLEGYRRFPGRISSIQAQCPMLNPAGDTMSYYTNQYVFPSADWLRWSWRAYLGLETPNETMHDKGNETPLEKVLRQNSNHKSWKRWMADQPCKAMHRLVNPLLAIPEGLNGDESEDAPTIILRYNKGDPLYNDTTDFLDALQQKTGGNAKPYEQMGIHSDIVDMHSRDDFWKAWSAAIFGV